MQGVIDSVFHSLYLLMSEFEWLDGGPVTYFNWPSDRYVEEYSQVNCCVSMDPDGDGMVWDIARCASSRRHTVCEYPLGEQL